MRRFQVARQIFEHCRLRSIDGMAGQKTLIHLRQRFGIEIGRSDVEHVFDMPVDFELLHHRVRVLSGAVGENDFAPRKLLTRRA